MIEDFAHRLTLDRIRDGERLDLVADETERASIAKRLDLDKIDRLEAHVVLARDGDRVRATGRMTAALDQRCVVTGEAVAARIDEAFDIAFTPEPSRNSPDEEIELDAEDCDIVFHDGAAIDLGAAIADTLALSVDPYPRSAGAQAALKDAGVLSEEEAGPFAVLGQLKKHMGGDES
ncbi:MAG: YceD family protein [Sphingomicrobium sp.]